MTTPHIKLSDMGTTGLVNYVVNGSPRMRGARLGKARAIIAKRYGRWDSVNAFTRCVNEALGC